jgi:aspartate 1-decarboxylase
MSNLIDKNGKVVEVGDRVTVPTPSYETDTWTNEFQATVIEVNENNESVFVSDQENNGFEVDPSRIEII